MQTLGPPALRTHHVHRPGKARNLLRNEGPKPMVA
jgi:hypothetical protein